MENYVLVSSVSFKRDPDQNGLLETEEYDVGLLEGERNNPKSQKIHVIWLMADFEAICPSAQSIHCRS